MNELTEVIASNQNLTAVRELKEVEAQIVLAKKFPRDMTRVEMNIEQACRIKSVARSAEYLLPIGGRTISGPTIKLAEVIAQAYGNADWGIVPVETYDDHGIFEAYFWDLENNLKRKRRFRVNYSRYSKKAGHKKVEDPSDIERIIGAKAARHIRDCIFGCVPKYVVEAAIEACKKTMGSNDEPLEQVIKRLVKAFGSMAQGQVTKEMLEERLGYEVEKMSRDDVIEYGKIFNGIKDGTTKRADWFNVGKIEPEPSDAANRLNSLNLKKETEPKKPEKKEIKKETIKEPVEPEPPEGSQESELKKIREGIK